MRKISEILIAAKALIDTPEKWTQHTLATDKNGHKSPLESCHAVCFCSDGAILKVTAGYAIYPARDCYEYKAASHFLNNFSRQTRQYGYVTYNDSHTHEEVMTMWDAAIQEAIARSI